jgi:DNA-binding MarR family transcriptional regulator
MTRAKPQGRSASKQIGSRHETPEASPGFVLWQVATLWQRDVREALGPTGLTHAQFVVLATSAFLEAERERTGEPLTQSDVAAQARTDAVMTHEVLRTLEKKKLIQRLAHPSDARARMIVLTTDGRRMARRAIAAVEKVDSAFFGKPGPELAALAKLLGR